MHFADIGNCFSSIYTHTLYWAIADKRTAKDNVRAKTFGNIFDKLMQSVNFNETNGICVGAEVSRIFAEIILSEVDRRVVSGLEHAGLRFRVDYEFTRYVDDFYIFSKNEIVANAVLGEIRRQLSEFNLQLKESKTEIIRRPFITMKSRMTGEVNKVLSAFFVKFLGSTKFNEVDYSYPLRIWRPDSLLRFLLDGVKSSCFDNKCGYDVTSNYIISALSSRIASIINGYEQGLRFESAKDDDYVHAIMVLLEAIYFFYDVNPTVQSSLRVAQSAILSFDFFEQYFKDRAIFLAEQIVRWTVQFVKDGDGHERRQNDGSCVALEAINMLVVLGEVGRGEPLARRAIADFCTDVDEFGYFEIIAFLYCLNDDGDFDSIRENLFQRARFLLLGKDRVRGEAHAAYLCLDLLSCPYIEPLKRARLFNELRAQMGLGKVGRPEALQAVQEFQGHPWFVNWRDANLLAMIRKKELSTVY